MNTPTNAILWELWRTSRIEILIRILALTGFTGLLFLSIPGGRSADQATHSLFSGVVFLFTFLGGICSQAWLLQLDRQQAGYTFRLGFSRPVSTRTLVAIPMPFTMAVAAFCYLVPTLVFALATQVSVPVFGPVVLIAATVALCLMATWSPDSLGSRVFGLAGVVSTIGLVLFFGNRRLQSETPFLLNIGKPEFFEFPWWWYAVLFGATA
ncbi:MAG: hypothetical protein ACR2NZ_19570, partial [Rubripirellula sp.]